MNIERSLSPNVIRKNRNSTSPLFGTVLPLLSEFSIEKSLNENYLLKEIKEHNIKPKTKIICTVGPNYRTKDQIVSLALNGMDALCLNRSHGSLSEQKNLIENIKKAEKEIGEDIPIIIETKSAVTRIEFEEGRKIHLESGSSIVLKNLKEKNKMTDENDIFVDESDFTLLVKNGEKIKIGFGKIVLEAINTQKTKVHCKVITGGSISSKECLYFPKDHNDIKTAVDLGADFISLSYVCNENQILQVKDYLGILKSRHVKIIAKIECKDALINFDKILSCADGILISRGNLGEEIDIEAVTLAQKLMIRKCNSAGKFVITASQMLESMVKNPFPTRAEASDVGNAVFDGTDCVMLSRETSIGKYPNKSTKMMKSICIESERSVNHLGTFRMIYDRAFAGKKSLPVLEALCSSAVKLAFDMKAGAIFVHALTGTEAKLLSKYRPQCVIIGITTSNTIAKELKLYRGVNTIQVESFFKDGLTKKAISLAKEKKILSKDYFAIEVLCHSVNILSERYEL